MTVLLVVLGLFFVYLIVSQYLPVKEGVAGQTSTTTPGAVIKKIITDKKIKSEPDGVVLTKSYRDDKFLQPSGNTLTYIMLEDDFTQIYKVTQVKKDAPGIYSCLLGGTPIKVSDALLFNDLGTNVPGKASGSSGGAKSGSSGGAKSGSSGGAKSGSSGGSSGGAKSGSSGGAKSGSSGGKAKMTRTIVTMTFKSP